MRVARVLGTVTLSVRLAEVPPGQFLLVRPQGARSLREDRDLPGPTLVAYDDLAAAIGSLVGISDGREATMPFRPRPVPFDLYSAAIVDRVRVVRLADD